MEPDLQLSIAAIVLAIIAALIWYFTPVLTPLAAIILLLAVVCSLSILGVWGEDLIERFRVKQ